MQNTLPFQHEQTTLPPSKLGLSKEEILILEGKEVPQMNEKAAIAPETKDDERSQHKEEHTKESEGASLYKREFLYEMYFKPYEIA